MTKDMEDELFSPFNPNFRKQVISSHRNSLNPSQYNEPIYDPRYENYLKGQWRDIGYNIWEKTKEWIGKKVNFRDLYFTLDKLPNVRDRNGRVIGKVRGVYQPDNMTMAVDEESINDPNVKSHELWHFIQDKVGAIGRYVNKFGEGARKAIEGIATKATEYATGQKQTTYPEEQKLAEYLIRKYGFDRAFEGKIPNLSRYADATQEKYKLKPATEMRHQSPKLLVFVELFDR